MSMKSTFREGQAEYDDRVVEYLELEIIGDTHVLTVRHYPSNTNLQMYNKYGKRDTKVTHKYPNDMFLFREHVSAMLKVFDVGMPLSNMNKLAEGWYEHLADVSF